MWHLQISKWEVFEVFLLSSLHCELLVCYLILHFGILPVTTSVWTYMRDIFNLSFSLENVGTFFCFLFLSIWKIGLYLTERTDNSLCSSLISAPWSWLPTTSSVGSCILELLGRLSGYLSPLLCLWAKLPLNHNSKHHCCEWILREEFQDDFPKQIQTLPKLLASHTYFILLELGFISEWSPAPHSGPS